jgi:hypothetical protein
MFRNNVYVFMLVIAMFILSGCATVSQATAKNRVNLSKLSLGMSKEDAIAVMGQKKFSAGNFFYNEIPVTINNPYRNEIVAGKDGSTLEVFYYVTDVHRNDGLITDDELTPLVFDNGKLIGWGQTFLNDITRKSSQRF